MISFFLGVTFTLLAVCASTNSYAGEADLKVPDLAAVRLMFDMNGRTVLSLGALICLFGTFFGFYQYLQIKELRVHNAMHEVAELIYSTCQAYLVRQGRFLLILQVLLGVVMAVYFGWLCHYDAGRVLLILFCSLLGIAGSYGVAWFGMRINTLANARSAFASLQGKPYPVYSIPLQAGMSIGMVLVSVELLVMLGILLLVNPSYAGPCFIGFAIGESLGASVLRIAGGIFTKIADIGADLMKIALHIKEDDARNPGVIADCVGDNAGDSVGPTADGFETYGVTAVALVSFILLAVKDTAVQAQLLVWLFSIGVIMVVASGISYEINRWLSKKKYSQANTMNFEAPLTALIWITCAISIALIVLTSYVLIGNLGDGSYWWKLALMISCGTLAGGVIPAVVKVFTSTESAFVKNVYQGSRKGGASLNILAGLVAGNFSAFYLGFVVVLLLAAAYALSLLGLGELMLAPAVFAFGLVAFGFLSMGPVTIAVDSYGPVSDNAQSIYELSLIETRPGIAQEIHNSFGFVPDFAAAKHFLEENDGAGNTFKATAKPVLIGTAVAGATTMIFSIIMLLTNGLTLHLEKLSLLHPPFFLGLLSGGAVIYWFTGASIQAVTSGAYHAVHYIKENISLERQDRALTSHSAKVVDICTSFAQKGMINLFMTILFLTLSFACLDPFYFIGYLISIAIFGLYQAIFMANAGGAWDNAKKLVEVTYNMKGTTVHSAAVVGDTVGDPFKDTAAVALNPTIKFTTLFGLLAIEIAIGLNRSVDIALALIFLAVALVFLHRSFFCMRIVQEPDPKDPQ